jgi:hypothetical protein
MKKICAKNQFATTARQAAGSRIERALSPPARNGKRVGIQAPAADRQPMTTKDSSMTTIGTAICRSFLLWLHLGIGPMLGAGPMQARSGRPTPPRGRSVSTPAPTGHG